MQPHSPATTEGDTAGVLPADYAQTVQPMGERRMILAGYRVADVLRQLFESWMSIHLTEKAIQAPATPLHDYLCNTVRQKLEEA
jgi:hypothetical protein